MRQFLHPPLLQLAAMLQNYQASVTPRFYIDNNKCTYIAHKTIKNYRLQCARCDICWSRNVFGERLKTAVGVDCRICAGSEFEKSGPAKETARRPPMWRDVLSTDRGAIDLDVDDLANCSSDVAEASAAAAAAAAAGTSLPSHDDGQLDGVKQFGLAISVLCCVLGLPG